MRFHRRFNEEIEKLLAEMGEGGDMAFRAESIEVAEQGIKALGLDSIVSDFLATMFNAKALGELRDEDLAQAFRFIARIQGHAGRSAAFPLAPGTVIDGRVSWVHVEGKVSLGV